MPLVAFEGRSPWGRSDRVYRSDRDPDGGRRGRGRGAELGVNVNPHAWRDLTQRHLAGPELISTLRGR